QGRDDGAHEEAQGEHRDHRRDEHGEPHPGDLTMRRELDHRTARGPRAELTEEGPPVAEPPSHRRRNLAPGDDDGEPDELHADRDRPRGVPPAREVTEPRDDTEDERDGHEREKLLDPVEHHEPEHSDLPVERTLAGETSRTPPPADRASRGPTTQRERTAEDGRDDEQRDEADLVRDVGEREPARDPAERVDDVGEREDAGERLEDLGHLGAGHGEAAQDELREERRRHELDGLELGARQGRRGETERAAEDRREHGAQHEYPQLAGDVHAAHPDRERDENERLDYREEPEGEGVARDEVALAERQAHEPLEGARGALAQRRDARPGTSR